MNEEYLDICERSLKKYFQNSGDQFNVDHALLMLQCTIICRSYFRENKSEYICHQCAVICVDCLDPDGLKSKLNLSQKFQDLLQYIRKEGGHGEFKFEDR